VVNDDEVLRLVRSLVSFDKLFVRPELVLIDLFMFPNSLISVDVDDRETCSLGMVDDVVESRVKLGGVHGHLGKKLELVGIDAWLSDVVGCVEEGHREKDCKYKKNHVSLIVFR
jgi:hypothetical protein